MKRIAILNTGGTISMSEDQTTGKVSPSSTNPLSQEGNLFRSLADLSIIDFFHLPSPHVTPQHMLELKNWIEAHQADFDGVVITHGTDTLEETAYFLELTLNLDIPVIITGAMRSSNEMGSDGLANLRSAIVTAVADQSRGKGVMVVMNEEIHTATYVTKTHTTNVATFQTPTFGPNGIVSKNQVLYFQKLIHTEHYELQSLTKQVALLKAYSGMTADLFDHIADSGAYSGLVIEGLGAGNLPPASLAGLKKVMAAGLPVVMVSRAFNGITEDVYDYEGGGKQLRQAGVIFTQGLSGVKARIKLLVLLNSQTPVNIAQAFHLGAK